MASGLFKPAESRLREMQQQNQLNVVALNNLAIVLLYDGQAREAVNILERAMATYTPLVLSETLVDNLCRLYDVEVDRERATERKRELLRRFAGEDSETPLPRELASL